MDTQHIILHDTRCNSSRILYSVYRLICRQLSRSVLSRKCSIAFAQLRELSVTSADLLCARICQRIEIRVCNPTKAACNSPGTDNRPFNPLHSMVERWSQFNRIPKIDVNWCIEFQVTQRCLERRSKIILICTRLFIRRFKNIADFKAEDFRIAIFLWKNCRKLPQRVKQSNDLLISFLRLTIP